MYASIALIHLVQKCDLPRKGDNYLVNRVCRIGSWLRWDSNQARRRQQTPLRRTTFNTMRRDVVRSRVFESRNAFVAMMRGISRPRRRENNRQHRRSMSRRRRCHGRVRPRVRRACPENCSCTNNKRGSRRTTIAFTISTLCRPPRPYHRRFMRHLPRRRRHLPNDDRSP